MQNCEEILAASDREMNAENNRHLNEWAQIRTGMRHRFCLEAQKSREDISRVFATADQHTNASKRDIINIDDDDTGIESSPGPTPDRVKFSYLRFSIFVH